MTWQRWLVGAIAGTAAYLGTHGAIEAGLGPGRLGNSGLYGAIAIGLVAGTVVAGLTMRARTLGSWIAAFLLTLLPVAGIGFLSIYRYVFTPGI